MVDEPSFERLAAEADFIKTEEDASVGGGGILRKPSSDARIWGGAGTGFSGFGKPKSLAFGASGVRRQKEVRQPDGTVKRIWVEEEPKR